MKNKILWLFIAFLSMLYAQDKNPFMNVQDLNTSMLAPENFDKQAVKFDSDARILKSITINYIALDGTEKSLNFDINKSIDWHDEFSFSKLKPAPAVSAIFDVSVTKPQDTNPQANESNQTLNIELPLDSGKLNDVISFANYTNRIKLATKDEMVGNFTIGNPSKIILDFQNNSTFPTKTLDFDKSPFKKIVFGSHKGYYRIVIYLDGKYNYRLEKDASGYVLYLL
ncbi:AMIN domain-containing protein [Campylobacter sp. MIT 99-7217]|uniref:AMIN domain-containing protein n=1 Tax=Campylobacter sp. MIT 99-7217 TaxID=535091 RepID=UPI0011592DF4|nr:AMIN domain-containing protein [Campylobacter sp. MIT 99-7217]TQR30304.1 AMIN domain-containing protein [Campylobacter sp. MIT 99-7217]